MGEGGSTLACTWADPGGDGQLQAAPGEPLTDRTRLGRPAQLVHELARIVHLTDAHVLDASSPARVPFLARLGPPVQSTFRPQEALTAHVLCGAIKAIRAFAPDLVLQGGDLIDNAQHNELERALALLNGGPVHPGSGPDGYYGVQSALNPDPFYYRPDVDTPHHPGLLEQAVQPFTSPGLGVDWLPVLGDHDALVAGELLPTSLTQSLAVGNRALWNMPTDLRLPEGFKLNASGSPDGPPDPRFVEAFLEQALAGPTIEVPADPDRRELEFAEVIPRLWSGAGATRQRQWQPQLGAAADAADAPRLDYVRDIGHSLRLVVLDFVRRAGGSGGVVQDGQLRWLEQQLADGGERWVIVASHHPLENVAGAESLFALLDRSPRVVAALAGHIHRNRIVPRETAAGGYWMISTCSLIDFPQQARALRLFATDDGGVALQTWMLDHVGNGSLGRIARELAYLDAQGGRAVHLSGTRWDRNATLFRRAAR